MKTLLRIAVSIMLTYALLNFTACTSSNYETTAGTNDDFVTDREELIASLQDLQNDVNEKLSIIEHKLESTTDEVREERAQVNQRLLAQRDELEVIIKRVENASKDSWNTVRSEARNTFKHVKQEFNELDDRIADQ